MKCDILTLDNKKAGSVDLADGVFGAEVRKDIIARMVAKKAVSTMMTGMRM